MPSNSQKVPVALSLNQAMARAAESRVQQIGKCLPCRVVSVKGAIITVSFAVDAAPAVLPEVAMPLFGPEYIRYPIQPGDKGFAVSADAYLGEMSGLGNGTADLTQQPNLSALSFLPCGNTGWRAVDPQSVVIYGPNGVVVQDAAQTCTLTLTPESYVINLDAKPMTIICSNITITTSGGAGCNLNMGANPLSITASNVTLDTAGNLAVTGNVTWGPGPTHAASHHHSGVQAGSASSGPPVAGT